MTRSFSECTGTLTRIRPRPTVSCLRRVFHPRVENLEDRRLLDATLLPGDLVPSAAAGTQSQAQIAAGDAGYLTVWTDARARLEPLAVVQRGTMQDIYAARLDVAGKILDTTPLIITQDPWDQYRPRLAWNGTSWLVAWVHQRHTGTMILEDVKAVRVGADGTVLDPEPILVYENRFTGRLLLWDVASDGANWVVTWPGPGPLGTIEGTRVAPDGVILDPGGRPLHQDAMPPTNADLAWAGDEYLMVWQQYFAGRPTVMSQRLTANLDPLGAPFPIQTSPLAPKVATDGRDFLVVWSSDTGFGSYVTATRVSHEGKVLDPAGIQVPAVGFGTMAGRVTWNGSDWVITYTRMQGGDTDVYAVFISSQGVLRNPEGRVVAAGTGGQQESAVAAGPRRKAQVVWTSTDPAQAGSEDIRSATVSVKGVAGQAAPLSLGAPRQSAPRLVWNGAGYLAVFLSQAGATARVLAQRLDATGVALDPEPIEIARGSLALRNPSAAWNGKHYLVVWEAAGGRGQVLARRVTADGTMLDPTPLVVMEGQTPDVSALGRTFLVVSIYPQTNQIRYPRFVRVAGDAVLDTPVRLGNSYDSSPRVATFGDRWLLFWTHAVAHDRPTNRLDGVFVTAAGAVGPLLTLASAVPMGTSGLAVAGDSALLVWDSGSVDTNIYGRRMHADGSFLDGPGGFLVSGAQGAQINPGAAWDGSQYVVTWLDHRADALPLHPRGDVYAARVLADGTVLDPDGLAVATSPRPEETPTVAAAGGVAVFAYAAFVDAAPYAAFRIVTQPLARGLTREPFYLDLDAAMPGGKLDLRSLATDFRGSLLAEDAAPAALALIQGPSTMRVTTQQARHGELLFSLFAQEGGTFDWTEYPRE